MSIEGMLYVLAALPCLLAIVVPPALAAFGKLWRGAWAAGILLSWCAAGVSCLLIPTSDDYAYHAGKGIDAGLDILQGFSIFGLFFFLCLGIGCAIAAIIYRKPAP